jgi:hypothetical protein
VGWGGGFGGAIEAGRRESRERTNKRTRVSAGGPCGPLILPNKAQIQSSIAYLPLIIKPRHERGRRRARCTHGRAQRTARRRADGQSAPQSPPCQFFSEGVHRTQDRAAGTTLYCMMARASRANEDCQQWTAF